MKGRSVPALSVLSYAYGRGLGAESVEELLGCWASGLVMFSVLSGE